MSWHVAILSLCIFNAFRIPFLIQAVMLTRLPIAHPPAPALGTYTRWRGSILLWYTGWRWSIIYWYTGWQWSILYSGDVGVEHRSLETV